MSEFVTLHSEHPKFRQYLLGSFSKEDFALPVRSMHVNSSMEQVTFQIVRSADIRRPAYAKILAQVLRFDLLSLTFAPVLAQIFFLRGSGGLWELQIWLLASLFFLHGAVFCRNDFIDHMRGVDRLSEKGGSQVIQRGWMRAVTVQKMYIAFFALAVILAVPIFLVRPELLLITFAAGILGVFGYPHWRWGRTHWLVAALALTICLGPLLTLGVSWALVREFNGLSILLGVYFGVLSLAYVEARHIVSMVVDDEAGLATMPVSVGFDKAKLVLSLILAIACVTGLILLYGVWATSSLTTSLPLTGDSLFDFGVVTFALVLVFSFLFLTRKISAISSPFSSSLLELPKYLTLLQSASVLIFFAVAILCQ